jgi:Dolichyl-phosphate-mannose-protein mannosyltransferase
MNWERRRFWLSAGAALVAGMMLRLWFVSHLGRVAGDSFIYGGIAKTLLLHGVYGFIENGRTAGSIEIRPTLIRLPGYPIFLAACFRLFGMEHYRAVMNVQVVADLVTCWLASALTGRLFGGRARLVVLWLAALCPFTASYVALPLTETLVLTSIALTFYGFARWQDAGLGYNRWLWIVAAAVASSVLMRPEQSLLAAAVLPAMLWVSLRAPDARSRPIQSALPVLAAALCVLLPLLPWTIRNWHTFKVFQPLVPRYANDPGEFVATGFGRWYRTWAIDFASTEEVYWNYNGAPIELRDVPERAFDAGSQSTTQELRDRTAALLDDYNVVDNASPQIDARFGALANERVHAHPVLYYVGLPITRLLNMMLRPRTEMMDIPLEWWRWSESPAETAFAATYAAVNLIYLAIGFAGFCVWRRRGWSSLDPPKTGAFRELALAMGATIVLRSLLLLTLDNSEPRYTLEFFPVLFVCAGALLERDNGG